MRHLTAPAAAATALLLLGCAGDDTDDGRIELDDTATESAPESLEDEPDDGGADTADPDAEPEAGTTDEQAVEGGAGDVLDGSEAVPGTWQVGEAGTITFAVDDGSLVLEDVSEAEGWTVTDTEEAPDEIEVDFQRGAVEIEIEVQLGSGGDILEVEIDTDIEDAEPGTYDIGDAGTFSIEVVDGQLELVDLTTNDGWEIAEQEVEADEIELELRSGAMRWDVDVDLDGALEIELDYEVTGQL